MTTAALNTKIENKKHDNTNMATKADLNRKDTEIENKPPKSSTLFRKTDYNQKVIEIKKQTF